MDIYKIEGVCSKVFTKDIIIYGLGMGALQRFIEFTRNQDGGPGIRVIGFTDTMAQSTDRLFCGRKIYSLAEVKEMGQDIEILIATYNAVYISQIIKEMKKRNIECGVYYLLEPCETGHWNQGLLNQYRDVIDGVRESFADERSKEIYDNLLEYRKNEDFKLITKSLGDIQYFPSFLTLREDEVFIDCGAYSGDTALEFLKHSVGKYHKIYAFEPDADLYEAFCTLKEIKGIRNLELYPYGIWNENTTLAFEHIGNGSSKIESTGKQVIQAVSLDTLLYDRTEYVSYVKMDIEGAEYNALLGMKKLIERDMPKLAVCVYHGQEDLWKIPALIRQLNPEYRLYLRHHSAISYQETVCYALP